MRSEPKIIKFPQDELDHNNIIEWWYVNGNLRDKKGNRYAFMDCVFKANAKKIKIPFLKYPILKNIYFFHSVLFDIKNNKSHSKIDYLGTVSKESFKKPFLFTEYYCPRDKQNLYSIKEGKKFSYEIKKDDVFLELVSAKRPLLESGKGFIDVCGKKSYYYSLTNLITKGELILNGKKIQVEGKSWMDHQWADVSYSKDKWSWFCFQFENNIELMCCQYENEKTKTCLSDIIYADGTQQSLNGLGIIPDKEIWKSKKTKALYPLNWKIEIPEKKIKLRTKAVLRNQEILFGSINYWEGPIDVEGQIDGKKVKGQGFMELVGYESSYNETDFAREELDKAAEFIYNSSRKKIKKIISKLA